MSDAFPQISKHYIRDGVTNEWYSGNKTFFFRAFLAFSIIPIPLEILFYHYSLLCPFLVHSTNHHIHTHADMSVYTRQTVRDTCLLIVRTLLCWLL